MTWEGLASTLLLTSSLQIYNVVNIIYIVLCTWVWVHHHSAQIPCTEAEPLKPGYMRVAKLLRFLLTAVKLIIYKNIFKALHIRTFNMPVFVVHVG